MWSTDTSGGWALCCTLCKTPQVAGLIREAAVGGGFSNIWVNGNCLRPRPDLHQPSVPQPPGPAPSAQHLRDVERGVAAALRARDSSAAVASAATMNAATAQPDLLSIVAFLMQQHLQQQQLHQQQQPLQQQLLQPPSGANPTTAAATAAAAAPDALPIGVTTPAPNHGLPDTSATQ